MSSRWEGLAQATAGRDLLADRGAALLPRLDRHAEERHRAVEAAHGAQRTERLMRELERLVERFD
jgi:hypothetical protein